MANVAVNPKILRWAIDRAGLTLESLRVKFPKIEDWLANKRNPTFKQLENFARTTMTPFGVMFLDEPPEEKLTVPDFRTKSDRPIDRPSPDLLATINQMQRRQGWMRSWRIEQGEEPLDFVGSIGIQASNEFAASQIRGKLKIGDGWASGYSTWRDAFRHLRRMVERAGILIFSNSVVGLNNNRKLEPDEFRGFVLCDDIAPLIFLNDADSLAARMFTLAHELVHIWVGTSGLFDLEQTMSSNNEIELFCNSVAAEILLPEKELMTFWQDVKNDGNRFQLIARKFKVSGLVAARKALDMGLLSEPDFFAYYRSVRVAWLQHKLEEKDRAKDADGGGVNFYTVQNARLGRPFSAAIVRAAGEGKVLLRDAYRLTGLKGKTFDKFAELVQERVREQRE